MNEWTKLALWRTREDPLNQSAASHRTTRSSLLNVIIAGVIEIKGVGGGVEEREAWGEEDV